MIITLLPPANAALYKRFTLSSGQTYEPNFARSGEVQVNCEQDARELEGEGWTRTGTKISKADVLLRQQAHEAALRRQRHF